MKRKSDNTKYITDLTRGANGEDITLRDWQNECANPQCNNKTGSIEENLCINCYKALRGLD